MIRSTRSRNTVLVAGLVALVYASLAVMAASCALRHVDPSNGHTTRVLTSRLRTVRSALGPVRPRLMLGS